MTDLVYTVDHKVPEKTIAYDQDYIFSLYKEHNLTIESIKYGRWCGREKYLSYQDIIVAVKS